VANIRDLKTTGHWPTLLAAFLYFDFSFMVWTMMGPLANEIAESLKLTQNITLDPSQIATLISTPILAGAILRLLLGYFVDTVGAKKTAVVSQMIVVVGLFYAYFKGTSMSYDELLAITIVLGFAGASFSVALPQAGQWYPPHLQGVVLGLAGAGNIGVVIDFIFAPKIAQLWGWESVFLVGAVLSLFILFVYIVIAKDATADVYTPRPKKLIDYARLLKDKDTWWFSLFYAISFGGFVGFAGYLKVFLIDTYNPEMVSFGLDLINEDNVKVVAGYFGAFCIAAGAILRPVGGGIADKFGGVKSLYVFYGMVMAMLLISGFGSLSFWGAIIVLFLTMANLGMANGAVFQLVPQRFSKDIGIMSGIIGFAGGMGGTALIQTLGWSKKSFGVYSTGFIIFALIVFIAIIGISFVKTRWRTTWGVSAGGKI
jgi:NNP family nitrate/nitrite transporter-like MFS transporter